VLVLELLLPEQHQSMAVLFHSHQLVDEIPANSSTVGT
jgi:hypothetical protein